MKSVLKVLAIATLVAMATWCLGSLGTGGVMKLNQFSPTTDMRQGWTMIRVRQVSNETALTDMDDAPADAVDVPVYCRWLKLRVLAAATAASITVELYGYPPDPGTDATADGSRVDQNDLDGEAAGWLIGTYSFTSGSRTSGSLDSTVTDAQYQGDIELVDVTGADKVAARITSVGGSTVEVVGSWY